MTKHKFFPKLPLKRNKTSIKEVNHINTAHMAQETSPRHRAKKRINDAMINILEVYKDKTTLQDTDVATMRELKKAYTLAKNGTGSYESVLYILKTIYKENKEAIRTVCLRCADLDNFKQVIINLAKDAEQIQRVAEVGNILSELTSELSSEE